MAPTRILLLRHGEVHEDWRGRVYGSLDIPLSTAGMNESERAARALDQEDLRAVISSGLARAEIGAALLRAPRALAPIQDPALRELERGAWAGRSVRELEVSEPGRWQAWFRRPSWVRPPGGENLEDLLQRVSPRVAHWAREFKGGSIAIVTHGWVVRVLVCHALGAPLDLAPRLDVRTGDIIVLRVASEGAPYELEAFALDLAPV